MTRPRPYRLARAIAFAGGLLMLATSLSACIVETDRPRGGWCYWHPGRCR